MIFCALLRVRPVFLPTHRRYSTISHPSLCSSVWKYFSRQFILVERTLECGMPNFTYTTSSSVVLLVKIVTFTIEKMFSGMARSAKFSNNFSPIFCLSAADRGRDPFSGKTSCRFGWEVIGLSSIDWLIDWSVIWEKWLPLGYLTDTWEINGQNYHLSIARDYSKDTRGNWLVSSPFTETRFFLALPFQALKVTVFFQFLHWLLFCLAWPTIRCISRKRHSPNDAVLSSLIRNNSWR